MLNCVILEGRLIKDCELKETNNGKKYCLNTLAVNQTKDKTDFIGISFFDKIAENVSNHCSKGDLISIEGNITSYKSGDTYKTVINVNKVHFLAKKQVKPQEVIK